MALAAPIVFMAVAAPMALRVGITILCGVGLYAAIFMLGKSKRAERGEIEGPSVVKTPQARLFGPSNALIGIFYYTLLLIAVWAIPVAVSLGTLEPGPASGAPLLASVALILRLLSVLGAVAAALTSLALAYSLLFITKRWCLYCWIGHAVNWLLLFLVLANTLAVSP